MELKHKARVWERVDLQEAVFLYRRRPSIWIANGTGASPFYAMLKSGQGLDSVLIHRARTIKDFYFKADFEASLKENYLPCASAAIAPGVFGGRLTRYLEEQFDFPPKDYYLRGSSEMIVAESVA